MAYLNHDDHIRAQASPWGGGVELGAWRRINGGQIEVATVQWEAIPDNAERRSLLTMPMPKAQVLMDDLWNAGIRPTDGSGSAGAMRAAEHHIADLRRVAFKVLGIE